MSRLREEIQQQPTAAADLLVTAPQTVSGIADYVKAHDIDQVVLVARGSSDNAARYAKYLFGLRHRLVVSLATPSLLSVYGVTPRFRNSLVIAVSQSGQSPDVVSVLAAAAAQGQPTLAITNDMGSPLAAQSGMVIDLRAGAETAVAATKTYVNSLIALALVSVALDAGPQPAGSQIQESLADLADIPGVLQTALDTSDTRMPSGLADTKHLLVTGRGLNYSTAFEVALKIRELTGVRSEAFSPPDLLHGPIGAVDQRSSVLLVAPTEPSLDSQRDLVPALRQRGANLLAITTDPELAATVDDVIPLGSEPAPWLTPIPTVVAGQLLALRWTAALGLDPDQPTGLSKVTRTR